MLLPLSTRLSSSSCQCLLWTTIALVILVGNVQSCLSSGSQCQSCSCSRYGCAKALASKIIGGPVDYYSSTGPTNTAFMTPDEIFMACCRDRNLPTSCLSKCSFRTFTKDALRTMFFKIDACPLDAASEMQYCAAAGRDHSECCIRNGVTTTLAGNKCLTFCDQAKNNVTHLDISYMPCFERFDSMTSCFWNDAKRQQQQNMYNYRQQKPKSSGAFIRLTQMNNKYNHNN